MRSRHQPDNTSARATSELAFKQLAEFLHHAVAEMSDREAGVLRLRFGLTDGYPRTLDEIGQTYGVTRERVRQIEQKAFQKLVNRHAGNDVLRALLDTDYSGLPGHVQERALGRPRQAPWWEPDPSNIIFCQRHQTQHLLRFSEQRCASCGCVAGHSPMALL